MATSSPLVNKFHRYEQLIYGYNDLTEDERLEMSELYHDIKKVLWENDPNRTDSQKIPCPTCGKWCDEKLIT